MQQTAAADSSGCAITAAAYIEVLRFLLGFGGLVLGSVFGRLIWAMLHRSGPILNLSGTILSRPGSILRSSEPFWAVLCRFCVLWAVFGSFQAVLGAASELPRGSG